jgi:hypothetical protein
MAAIPGLAGVGKRCGHTGAGQAVHGSNGFIERASELGHAPMAEFLLGGLGSEVRLKLLLSMLWMAGGPLHDTTYPARTWATLRDLPRPESNDARRVTTAIAWLEERAACCVPSGRQVCS